jgi:PST family polysaccharide transporter
MKNIFYYISSKAFPLYLAQFFSAMLPLLLAPLIIKEAGISVFGAFSGYLLVIQISQMLTDYSFDILGTRTLAEKNLNAKVVYTSILFAKLLLLIGFGVITILVFWMLFKRYPHYYELILIATAVIGNIMSAPWFLIYNGRTKLLACVIGFSKVSTLLLSFIYIYSKPVEYENEMFLFLFALPSFIFGCLISIKYLTTRSINFKLSLYFIRTGFQVFIAKFASNIQNMAPSLLVGAFTNVDTLGVYTAIDRVSRFLSATLKPVLSVLYPENVKAFIQGFDVGHRRVVVQLKIFSAIGLIFTTVSVLLADQILIFIYNDIVADKSILLTLLMCWLTIGLVNNAIGIQGLLAYGKDKYYSKILILGAIVSLALAMIASMQAYFDKLYAIPFCILIGELFISYFLCRYYFKLRNERRSL